MSRRAVWRLSAAMVLFEGAVRGWVVGGFDVRSGLIAGFGVTTITWARPAGNKNHSLILITATP